LREFIKEGYHFMNKQTITDAFRNAIIENENFAKAIYGSDPVPAQIEDTILAISSVDFIDLIIDVENRLDTEFSEDCMTDYKIPIKDLVERIEACV